MRTDFGSALWFTVTEAQLAALVIDVHHEMIRDGEPIWSEFEIDVSWCKALQRKLDPAAWTAAQKWLHPNQ